MAEESDGCELILNTVLCFTLTKLSHFGIDKIKNIIIDFFSNDTISLAKKQLLHDIERRGLTQLPRYPERHGDKKKQSEVNDILNIITVLDEKKELSKLPTYVTDNTENIPSVRIEDGDLAYLMTKINKLEGHIVVLQRTVNSLSATISDSSKTVVNNGYAAAVMSQVPSLNYAAGSGSEQQQQSVRVSDRQLSVSSGPAASRRMNTIINNNNNNNSVRQLSYDRRVESGSEKWSDAMDLRDRRPSTSAESCGDDGDLSNSVNWDIAMSRRKRKRILSGRQNRTADRSADQPAAINNGGSQSTQRLPNNDQRRQLNKTNRFNRRQPLLVGKSINAGNSQISAARIYKLVFCIDNVSLETDESKLTEFVKSLGVRVVNCHEVQPRRSRWQRENFLIANHRTFRLCINKFDKGLLLNPDKWPVDIIISRWNFKSRHTDTDAESTEPHGDRVLPNADRNSIASAAFSVGSSHETNPKELVVAAASDADQDLNLYNTNLNNETVEVIDMDDTLQSVAGPAATGTPIK